MSIPGPPAPGNYYIINRLLSSTGDKLAITFNGVGKPVTVTALAYSDTQKVWIPFHCP